MVASTVLVLLVVPTTRGLAAALLAAGAVLLASGRQTNNLRLLGPQRSRALAHLLQRLPASHPDALPARQRVVAGILVGLGLGLVVPGVAGAVVALVAAVGAFLALGRLESSLSRRGRHAFAAALPEALDLLSASLEAGAPLRLAVHEVATLGPPATREAFAQVAAQVAVGVGDADAWHGLVDHPLLGPVARDLGRSAETGSALADLLRQHAADARDRRHEAMLKRARAVGVRSVLPLMCCFLPAFLLTGVVPIVASMLGAILHR